MSESESTARVTLAAPNGRSISLSTGLFINNEFVPAVSGGRINAIDPATELDICSVDAASTEDIDKAVTAARQAFNNESWRDLPGSGRGILLHRLADLIEANKEDLATLEAWDNGKPYEAALGLDLAAAVGCIRYYAGWADKISGTTIPTHSKKLAYTLRQPVGVCGQIIPWNYPILMAAWKLGPALATGNTVVLKPAEQTPLSALYLANLVVQAGFPPGVVNIVNGYGRDAGAALASHMDVDKIAFTGSTATGRLIQKAASGNLKNISLETGGKNPLIVFADADLSQAAKWAHIGSMGNQGQVCTASSRLLVHERVVDQFVEAYMAQFASWKIGNPFELGVSQGPQVTKAQYESILNRTKGAVEEGAVLVSGGKPFGSKGYFIEPTVFKGVSPSMKIYREEVFGPVVTITSFQTEDEALQRANETEYGLAASVFTRDIELAHRMASRLEAGMVWVNSTVDSDWRVPFGGVKQSGIGRELGEAGLQGYLQDKAVHVNLGTVIP
ncbi:aldehyde dehydrogenase [Thozetella sp. PMI_491]|nr:aldehyde dehydrogenase [Thozetella sp. PMI_491]